MPRTISSNLQQEINAIVADARDPLILLEITQDQLAMPIRVVNDTSDIVSNGDLYIAYPFDFVLPNDQEQQPRASLSIDNVGPELMQWLELSRGAPGAKLKAMIISRGDPDTIEADFTFDLKNISADFWTVTGQLMYRTFINEPGVPHTFDEFNAKALF